MITFKQFLESDDLDDMVSSASEHARDLKAEMKSWNGPKTISAWIEKLGKKYGVYTRPSGRRMGKSSTYSMDFDVYPHAPQKEAFFKEIESILKGNPQVSHYERADYDGGNWASFWFTKGVNESDDDLDDMMSAHGKTAADYRKIVAQWHGTSDIRNSIWALGEPDLKVGVHPMSDGKDERTIHVDAEYGDTEKEDEPHAIARVDSFLKEIEAIGGIIPGAKITKHHSKIDDRAYSVEIKYSQREVDKLTPRPSSLAVSISKKRYRD